MIGKSISHYRIVEKQNPQRTGEVFLAKDTDPNRQLAISISIRSHL